MVDPVAEHVPNGDERGGDGHRGLRRVIAGLALLIACGAASCGPPQRVSPAPTAFDPDSVASAYATPTAALWEAGATRSFLVRPDGGLTNGVWSVRVDCAADDRQARPPHRIAYEERWLPVVHWRRWAAAVCFDFEAVATAAPAPADSDLYVSLWIQARNTGTAPASVRIALDLEPLEGRPAFVAADPPRERALPGWTSERAARRVCGGVRPQTPEGPPRFAWTLAPGSRASIEVTLSAYVRSPSQFTRDGPRDHARLVAQVRERWKDSIARGAQFELADPEVEQALRAATVVLLSARERRGREWLPIGGPFQYRDVWLRDGARAVAALAVLGYGAEARSLAAGFERFHWDNGAFLSQRGQLDGPGQALWAFAQAGLRPSPDSSLAHRATLVNGAVGWFARQRELGSMLNGRFTRLLPVADPRDNERVFGQLVGNDAWAIAGLRAAAELLRRADRPADAARADELRGQWQREFEAALEASEHSDIPPSWQNTGHEWGNLAVGWPCRALPPAHPRLARLADRYWGRAGGPGLGWYGSPDTLHGYLGADLGTWAMLADRPGDALAVLEAHLDARDATGGAAETFRRDAGEFHHNLPPHPTAAAAVVALVRNALLYDDEPDTLRLTLAAREPWWRGARVMRAPTRWGLVDLSLRAEAGRASWAWTPVPVWTRITLPVGARLQAAPAAPLVGFAGQRSFLAPPGTARAEIAFVSTTPARAR